MIEKIAKLFSKANPAEIEVKYDGIDIVEKLNEYHPSVYIINKKGFKFSFTYYPSIIGTFYQIIVSKKGKYVEKFLFDTFNKNGILLEKIYDNLREKMGGYEKEREEIKKGKREREKLLKKLDSILD